MTDATEVLRRSNRILLHDWPDQDVPDSLALAGFDVTVWGGPAPDDVYRSEVVDGEVVTRKTGVPPDKADLVYVYRPVEELPRILDEAKRIGATTLWRQSGLDNTGASNPRGCAPDGTSGQWRTAVEAAGLQYVEEAYIGDTARQLGGH